MMGLGVDPGATLANSLILKQGCSVTFVQQREEIYIMRYKTLTACLLAAIGVVATQHVWGDTMRCGNKLIMTGDSMAAVRAYCGRPTVVQSGLQGSANTVRVGGESHTVGAEVPVETWTYNRGPKKLMMRIRFVNGTVVAIKTLSEYGQ